MDEIVQERAGDWARRVGLVLGPLLFFALLVGFDPVPEAPQIGRMAAVAALMATWWITEALPIPVTSLLPLTSGMKVK